MLISTMLIIIGFGLLIKGADLLVDGASDIAIGNIIGSNIFNMLLIVGTSAIIKPIMYSISYNKDMLVFIIATTILMIFPLVPPKNKMSRMNGIIYVLMYIGYMVSLFI